MADDIIISGQIVTSVSKKHTNTIMPCVEFAELTDHIFEFPYDVMLNEQQRLDEQLEALEALRRQAIEMERKSCIPYSLGEWDATEASNVEHLLDIVRHMLSNFDNDFSRHSRIILELLDALLLDLTENGTGLPSFRKRIHHWKTNLTAIRKAFK